MLPRQKAGQSAGRGAEVFVPFEPSCRVPPAHRTALFVLWTLKKSNLLWTRFIPLSNFLICANVWLKFDEGHRSHSLKRGHNRLERGDLYKKCKHSTHYCADRHTHTHTHTKHTQRDEHIHPITFPQTLCEKVLSVCALFLIILSTKFKKM